MHASGAPSGSCDDMMPHHDDYVPQTSTPPYSISLSQSTVPAGNSIEGQIYIHFFYTIVASCEYFLVRWKKGHSRAKNCYRDKPMESVARQHFK